MPVIDHLVSEMTKRTGKEPYGCSNKQRKDGYWTAARDYLQDGTFCMRLKYIKNTLSKQCNYDQRRADPRCVTCNIE